MPPTGDPPATPPDTPNPGNGKSGRGGEDTNIDQGPVNFQNAANYGGVQTGNIIGYNLIIGTINVALDSAKSLTRKIDAFVASVEAVSLRLKSLGEKVGATATVINNINGLVVKQSRREGISDKDVTKDANLAEVKDRVWVAEKAGEKAPEVLSKKCFKDLMEAIKSADRLFDDMVKKIEAASDTLIRPQMMGRRGHRPAPEPSGEDDKVRLDEADKERLFLTEEKIRVMELDVEARKAELNISFEVFEWAINDENQEQAQERQKTVERIETEVIEELFESFEELRDPKGKKPSRRHDRVPELRMRSDSDTGIVRGLMRRVERKSQERMDMEQEHIERAKLE
ncbi:hypothetical protein C8A03DRAFT_38512, partial [Achaetomium macrosporum]